MTEHNHTRRTQNSTKPGNSCPIRHCNHYLLRVGRRNLITGPVPQW